MGKHCETFEHTADVGLDARADSLEQLLEALAEGLAGVIHAADGVEPRQSRTVQVEAEDLESLTVDFLWQLMDLLEADLFLLASVAVSRASAREVVAEVRGEPYDEARHRFTGEVKAVTYHELEVGQEDGGGWRARVILDL
jgi:SHS2 domain-containing protein